MWKSVWLLIVLAVLVDSGYEVRRGKRQTIGQVAQQISKALANFSPVPFWQSSEPDGFACNESGYYADPHNCNYFHQCVVFLSDHPLRFTYRCNDDRVYSIEKRNCVMPDESDRVKCGGRTNRSKKRSPPTYQGARDLDQTISPNVNERLQKDYENLSDGIRDLERIDKLPLFEEPTDESTTTTPETENEAAISTTMIFLKNEQFSEETKHLEPTTEQATDGKAGITASSLYWETDTTSVEQIEQRVTTVSESPPSIQQEYSDESEESRCIDEGFFGVLDDCSKFYRCVPVGHTFLKYIFSCSNGTIWDDHLKTCNFRAAIREITCQDKRTSSTTSERSSGSSEVACLAGNLTADQTVIVCPTSFRRLPKYCNVFYQCTTNESLHMNFVPLLCPENTFFNEDRLECTSNEVGERNDCVNFERLGTLHANEMFEAPSTKLCPAEGQFPYGGNCSVYFFKCEYNSSGALEGYLQECPHGQVYSSSLEICDTSLYELCTRNNL
ncbi:uncharacterized protein LOC128875913 isoform X1 [Hylaeus volcanicus]|uniref:uncharacterized protein LOC128875913 isoform X1 n=1 Tax=Hylaeus volcanicus TaxID=313075 RepID=UPI0023B7F5F8|nr:uncharacterized protein LOC128875913 isoform X1 [Hylaeus volcanicus]